ncbi:ABC transporter permease [Metamycoplasma buccale]|uniref:ABC transporter permease n=1 Tax=Metamycoplasma buccale TaxID=55602 RepID=UPI00398EA981
MNQYFKLKMKIASRAVGFYLIPALTLLFQIIGAIIFTILRHQKTTSALGNGDFYKTTYGLIIYHMVFLATYIIYLTHLFYYDDRKNGLQYIMTSKPLSRGQIYFANLGALLTPASILTFASWIATIGLFASFGFNNNLILKAIIPTFISTVLFTLFFAAFCYFVASFTNQKAFPLLAQIPLYLPIVTLVTFSIDTTRKNGVNELGDLASKNQFKFLTRKNTKTENEFAYESKNGNSVMPKLFGTYFSTYFEEQTKNLIENNKKLTTPKWGWLSPITHIQNIYESFTNVYDPTVNFLTSKVWIKNINENEFNLSKYVTFDAKNKNNVLTKYIFSRGSNINKNLFPIVKNEILLKLNEVKKILSEENVKKAIDKLIKFIQKLKSHDDVYNSNEVKSLLSSIYNNVIKNFNFDSFNGDFLKAYLELVKQIGTFTSKTEDALFYWNILSPYDAALYFLVKYYDENRNGSTKNIKKIDLLSYKNLKGKINQFDEQDIENFFLITKMEDYFNSSNELNQINYLKATFSLAEANSDNFKIVKVGKSIHVSGSILLPLFISGFLISMGYLINKKRSLK